jgi:hypothetical protein
MRAAGYYVPDIDDRDIRIICKNVAWMYGEAQNTAHQLAPERVHEALDRVERTFGNWSSQVFGIDAHWVLSRDDGSSYISMVALNQVCDRLTVTWDHDSKPVIGIEYKYSEVQGIMGSIALGVFTRIAGSVPGLDFAAPKFFDYYYVASSFIPSRTSVEESAAFQANPAARTTTDIPVNGVFDSRLGWLKRVFEGAEYG